MICDKCGKELPDGALFCSGCGNKIISEVVKKQKKKSKIKSILFGSIALMLVVAIGIGVWYYLAYVKVNVGDDIWIGEYCDSDLKWEVIEVKGNKMLLICSGIVEVQKFSEGGTETNWKESSIRSWLNEEFYFEAFNTEEQNRIIETELDNFENSKENMGYSNETKDKIFILSSYELNEYFDYEYEIQTGMYETAVDTAVELLDEEWKTIYQYCWSEWWTRTSNKDDGTIKCIRGQSYAEAGYTVEDCLLDIKATDAAGVRPAMWITIE